MILATSTASKRPRDEEPSTERDGGATKVIDSTKSDGGPKGDQPVEKKAKVTTLVAADPPKDKIDTCENK